MTVIIVLGLILLLSALIFIALKMTLLKSSSELVAEDIIPVKTYVEECVRRAATQAVVKAGQQGGYIEIPLNINNNPSTYVNIDRLGIIKMPYWFYKGQRYDPSKKTIEQSLAKYIETNAVKCINDFQPFKKQFTVTALDKFKATPLINEEDISIAVEYPVKISYRSNNSQQLISQYYVILPVKLGKIIDAADKILEAELNSFYLENFTIDLMATNPEVPLTDMDFSCKPKEWRISTVRKELQTMVQQNLPRIRIKNTDYRPFLADESKYKELLTYHLEDIGNGKFPKDVPKDAYEYLHMFWDVGLEKQDLAVGIEYISSIDMDIVGRPNDNGLLQSKIIQGSQKFLKLFCVNMWHFTYDLNYPVVVTIRDDSSFDGKGYIFSFAMPVTIKNNEAFKGNYGYELFQGAYVEKGFCDELGKDVFDIRALGSEEGYSNVELNNVNISLQCIKYYCDIGKTKSDEGSYRLRTFLPAACSSPFIIAEKQGYRKAVAQIDTSSPQDIFRLKMKKVKQFNYGFLVHRYNSLGGVLGAGEPMENDMNLTIMISDLDTDQYILYDTNSLTEPLELLESEQTYNIDISLLQGNEYVGGFHGNWTPSADSVSAGSVITFHLVKYMPTPYSKEDKMKMMAYIMKGDYMNTLKPEIS